MRQSLVLPSEWAGFQRPPRTVLKAYKHSQDWYTWTILSYCSEDNTYWVSRYEGQSARGSESDAKGFAVLADTVAEQKYTRDQATAAYEQRCQAEA